MKALALLTVCTLPITARGVDFFDNFESYAAGSQIHGQGGWKGWGNNPAAGALVSGAFAFSGTNSVNISAGSDLVHEFSGATNGQWTFSVRQYVPSTSAGQSYLDLYSQYSDAGPWDSGVKTSFNMGTELVTAAIGTPATLPLLKNQWVTYRAEIDLDADTVSEYYNNALLSTHTWGGTLQAIQSVNFYANNAGPVYYDDVRLAAFVPEAPRLSITRNGEGSVTTSTSSGRIEQSDSLSTSNWLNVGAGPITVAQPAGTRFYRGGTGGGYHAPPPTSTDVRNVRLAPYNATGNGSTNDTAAIQAAINAVQTGGTVLVPAGTYMINALVSLNINRAMTLKLEPGAVLKAIPNSSGGYAIVKIASASNVNVVGGTIQGERDQHLTPGNLPPSGGIPGDPNCRSFNNCYGQWGMGIAIYSSSAVYVEGVLAKDCWGDGFYVDGNSANVNFYSVVADYNRRQGMSVVWADGVVVRDSIFKNTRGHNPQAGIDLEPDPGDTVRNVQILNSQFINNYFAGIALLGPDNVTISGNTLTDDEIRISSASNASVTGNNISGELGFFTWGGATGCTITGNTLTVTTCYYPNKAAFTSGGNTVTNNTGCP